MSSGNLTADRRFAYAQSLQAEDPAAAAEVMAQALELAPQWAEGQFALAEMLAIAGQRDNAIAGYGRYLTLDPADSMGAVARLALLGASPALQALPEAYITRLFDQYAARFETSLVEKLEYRAPELLRTALDAVAPERRFARAYDLGCGTGLMGVALRERVDWLAGVDLSPAMVRIADEKRIYDALTVDEMADALRHLNSPCDLIVAADVLVYLGELAPLFAGVRGQLTDDGLFAFTLQRKDAGDFALGPEQRFSHSRDYLRRVAADSGFDILRLDDVVCRREKGIDVPGLLAILSPARAPQP